VSGCESWLGWCKGLKSCRLRGDVWKQGDETEDRSTSERGQVTHLGVMVKAVIGW